MSIEAPNFGMGTPTPPAVLAIAQLAAITHLAMALSNVLSSHHFGGLESGEGRRFMSA
jgi:hypothetical protein